MKKQHKGGTCKVSGSSLVFSAFYADFCLCPKLVIITTLSTVPASFICIRAVYIRSSLGGGVIGSYEI